MQSDNQLKDAAHAIITKYLSLEGEELEGAKVLFPEIAHVAAALSLHETHGEAA